MSLKDIRKRYGVPAYRGRRICFLDNGKAKYGTIVSGSDYIRVRFDDQKAKTPYPLHPTWNVTYLEEDKQEPT